MIESAVTKIQIWPRVGILGDDLEIIRQRLELAKRKNLTIPKEDISLFRTHAEDAQKLLEEMECLT